MIEQHPVRKLSQGKTEHVEDALVAEQPLEIRVRGKAVAVTMRTPAAEPDTQTHDAELAAGFLLSESVIQQADDIARIEPCTHEHSGNVVNVFLKAEVNVDFDKLSRHVFGSSSCGVCGKASIEHLHHQFPPVHTVATIQADTLATLPDIMRQHQPCFDQTGGLHAAGLFDTAGKPLVIREDIGRHNAVDKTLGHALLNGRFPLDRCVLVVSGRVSFEIVQKALAGGIPIIAAVSAPSSLAVELAEDAGITLAGFVRSGTMNVYCGTSRII